ncbi:hypothetical protein VZT92_014943 [Zoarces viviparus]|uniref:Uncharacterized protein n=1 Tax=Zoarces viviparus TaxID=48416 RepID=A0AAW1EVH2_ZOAVI
MLQILYHVVVAGVIFYPVVCWASRVKAADANRLNKLTRKSNSVLGVELESVVEVSERKMLRKLIAILDNTSNPLHATLKTLQSTFSCRPPRCTRE